MFLMGRRLTGSQAHNTWDYGYYKREQELSAGEVHPLSPQPDLQKRRRISQ
ncbi:hypothetical protein D4764_16G0005360 [Takifugu flavidus]|uniref:Uncharacterized protein n=1 Tax=Takifugu flavidus TaxID=433684 RepID=A0A5C6NZG1_9TELE|nr:hypothetical protein D4764_16G0005360 [Takifugu flavidus]